MPAGLRKYMDLPWHFLGVGWYDITVGNDGSIVVGHAWHCRDVLDLGWSVRDEEVQYAPFPGRLLLQL